MVIRRAEKRHQARLIARLHRHVCYLSKNNTEQPAPDPAIGAAATQNAEVGKEMVQLGRDQLQWNKDRYDAVAPQYNKLIDQQVQIGDANITRANQSNDDYNNIFRPNEARIAKEASEYGGEADQQNQAGLAVAGVTNAFDANAGNVQRQRFAQGVNPNDAKFQAGDMAAGLTRATAAAGAGTKAATDTRLMGMQMRQNLAQFGRNMPMTSLAQDSAALNAGNSATGNISGQTAAHNAGVNSAMPWYNGGTDATTSSGNLGLGSYNAQLGGWRTGMQADASGMAGLGQLAGTIGAAMIMAKDGGMVKDLPRRGFADGGMVDATAEATPANGMMRRGSAPNTREIVIVLPDPAIDPSDGTPLSPEDMPTKGSDCHGLEYGDGQVEQRPADLSAGKPAYADGGIVRPTEPGMYMAAAPAMAPLRSGGGVVEGGAPSPDNREGQLRYFSSGAGAQVRYAEGGLVDAQPAPAPAATQKGMSEKSKEALKKGLTSYKGGGTPFVDEFKSFAGGGLVNYQAGGNVSGPGTTTSDSVDAKLSNKEAVLNAPAVEIVGEDFVNRLNAAGLAMAGRPASRNNPVTIEGQSRRVA